MLSDTMGRFTGRFLKYKLGDPQPVVTDWASRCFNRYWGHPRFGKPSYAASKGQLPWIWRDRRNCNGWAQFLLTLQHVLNLDDIEKRQCFLWHCLRIGFFPHDCPRDEILPVMSKIWAKLVECGSDIHKRKSAVQLLYAEILTLATWFAIWNGLIWYECECRSWFLFRHECDYMIVHIDVFPHIFTELLHVAQAIR